MQHFFILIYYVKIGVESLKDRAGEQSGREET